MCSVPVQNTFVTSKFLPHYILKNLAGKQFRSFHRWCTVMTSLLFSNLQKKSVINDGDLSGDLSFKLREGECLLRLPAVGKLLVGGGSRCDISTKTKEVQ